MNFDGLRLCSNIHARIWIVIQNSVLCFFISVPVCVCKNSRRIDLSLLLFLMNFKDIYKDAVVDVVWISGFGINHRLYKIGG